MTRLLMVLVGVLSITMTFPQILPAAPGDLDPTFGTGGKVITDFGDNIGAGALAIALQPDGKLVVAGVGAGEKILLVRYAANGSVDTSFGVSGQVATGLNRGSSGEPGAGVVVQPDGKIVVAATMGFLTTQSDLDFVLTRFNQDGSLDEGFGIGGKAATNFAFDGRGRRSIEFARTLLVQPDGKLVAAGGFRFVSQSGEDFALARYNPDGSLDPAFGTGGKVTTNLFGFDALRALIYQPDGKFVAAGTTLVSTYPHEVDFALVRYNPDGSLDPAFGTGGKVTTDVGGVQRESIAFDLILQPDGKLVAAGKTRVSYYEYDFALVRYNPDGSLDPAFGTGGQVTTDVGGAGRQNIAFDLVLQPDGKLVAAGLAQDGTTQGFALVRYNSDGGLDPTFGVGGKVISPEVGVVAFAVACSRTASSWR